MKKMKVRVLRYKKRADIYGHMVFMDNDRDLRIWPTNIPDLFPSTASIESIRNSAINQSKTGSWDKDLDNYDMVDAEIEILN